MLRFGDKDFTPPAPPEGEAPATVAFARYVIAYMQSLNFEIQHAVFSEVYGVFVEHAHAESVPAMEDFMKHPDPEVQSFVVGAVVDKHKVSSRWAEVHQIYSAREEDLLNKALMDSLHLLKLSDNRKEIDEIQEQLAGLNEGIEQNEEAAVASMRELLNAGRHWMNKNATSPRTLAPRFFRDLNR